MSTLAEQIRALLDLDDQNVLAPHGVGPFARTLLETVLERIDPDEDALSELRESLAAALREIAGPKADVEIKNP